ncbi:MAG: hypothetical protein ABI876_06150, partial [Bacteroidota bacterium]
EATNVLFESWRIALHFDPIKYTEIFIATFQIKFPEALPAISGIELEKLQANTPKKFEDFALGVLRNRGEPLRNRLPEVLQRLASEFPILAFDINGYAPLLFTLDSISKKNAEAIDKLATDELDDGYREFMDQFYANSRNLTYQKIALSLEKDILHIAEKKGRRFRKTCQARIEKEKEEILSEMEEDMLGYIGLLIAQFEKSR